MQIYADMLGRTIALKKVPNRIISLVPSQTELLFDLGLEERIVGITKFCIHPKQWFDTKVRVGGTKNVHIETVKQLKPDLIVGNKEENLQEQIKELSKIAPVWLSDINTFEEAMLMISCLSVVCGVANEGEKMQIEIRKAFEVFKNDSFITNAVYFIWKSPWMAVGNHTFIHDIMSKIGIKNVLSNQNRYPEIDLQSIQSLAPEFVLLSSEPYPFKGKHIAEIKKQLPHTNVLLVDGEMFSWYGSRLLQSAVYFTNELLPAMKILKYRNEYI